MDNKEIILEVLEREYGNTTTALEFSNPFELLIATILSAQTTDAQVNRITRELFAKYKSPEELAKAEVKDLVEEIKSCGLFRNKAKNIAETAMIIVNEYGGEVPCSRESLMRLPGVGRKTANVVLANAFAIPAIGVDTHVFRVARRLGLVKGKNPLQVEEELMENIPSQKWAAAHHWLIWHGRKVCKARRPSCEECKLVNYCPRKEVQNNEKEKAD